MERIGFRHSMRKNWISRPSCVDRQIEDREADRKTSRVAHRLPAGGFEAIFFGDKAHGFENPVC